MLLSLPPYVCACMDTLEQAGFEAWAVGGCVRDLLRGVMPHDYDVTTSAPPGEVLRLFPHAAPTGISYGTVSVVMQEGIIEVTTFRTEADYQGFRRPECVCFANHLQEDLARRDFTVNAMAYAPARGLYDLFSGQEDLKRGVIRAVGEPGRRFEEDALRVLRAFRFASQLDFSIERVTLDAALSWAGNLAYISAERVAAELLRALYGLRPSRLLPLLRSGALSFCGVNAPASFPAEPFDHLPQSLPLRLASLCFLCGAQATRVCAALKLGNALRREAEAYERQLRDPLPQTGRELKERFSIFPPECWWNLLRARSLLFEEQTQPLRALCEEIQRRQEPWRLSQLAVDGSDLQALGIPPGRELGALLQALLHIVLEHPEWNTRKTLLQIAQGAEH